MAVRNRDIAGILNEVADLLDIKGANSFRVRSYRSAARTVEDLDEQVADLVERGSDLSSLPDVGDSIAGKLEQIVRTGRLEQLEELRSEMDADVTELLDIPNIGPAGARKLFTELGVTDAEGVVRAAEAGKIAELDGFGETTQEHLLRDARRFLERGTRERLPLGEADDVVTPLLDYLNESASVKRAVAAGSYRRRKETIGDLDIVAVCDDRSAAMDAFVDYERVESVVSHGSTRSTVVLTSGLHVDLRAVGEESYGAALYYFTGSKQHNIATRRIAQDRGLKINEYGVFDGDDHVAGGTEESVFDAIDLPYIVPELREDRGEVEAAREDGLPDLIRLGDIRGDLHMHSTATDGKNSIREMAEAAARLGYEYIAITDHSKRVSMANGLDVERLERQIDEIERVNGEVDGIRIFSGIEVDILKDGSLDLPDEVLARLDVVVASVHYDRDMSETEMTDRIVTAITDHPVSCVGHPTGRMIGVRDPYPLDLGTLFEAAVETGVALELNANPERLDLNDQACRSAVEAGASLAIGTDAHSTANLGFMRYGVDTARRGWVEASRVLNTLSADDVAHALSPGGCGG
ncbi:MAG: DNA polymerase/3'-5' exonuclease PolX [Spirochaetota bacterium]